MAVIATQAKFAEWYSTYTRFPFFAERAALVRGRFSNLNSKILIAGCGPGYLLQELTALGYTDVWGCDASTYCKTQATAVLPANLSARVITANITVRTSLTSLKTTAGLTGTQKFAAVITEDCLPSMSSDAEVQTALTELRRITNSLGHIITCADDSRTRSPDFLWRTSAQWKALVGSASEWILNTETGGLI